MGTMPPRTPCEHPVNDRVEITDVTETKNFRYGRRQVITGYYCLEHRSFGSWSYIEAMESRANPGGTDGVPPPCTE